MLIVSMKLDPVKIGACAGIAASLVFAMAFALAVANYEGYNFASNYISDLGAGGISSVFFNYGMIISGFLGILLGYGLINFFKQKGRLGAKIFMPASVFLVGVGILPEQYEVIHLLVSTLFFLLSAIAILLIGFELKSNTILGYLAFMAGIIPFTFVATGLPIIEHIAVFGIVLSAFVISVYILISRSR